MAIPKKIIKHLDESKVKYEIVSHRTVYTAYDKAATLKIKPNIIGKTLILKADIDLVVVLISGNKNLDKNKFKKTVNIWRKKIGQKPAKSIGFVSERVMRNNFKGIKIGAMPPFGNLWKLPTFIDKSLLIQNKIIINGGDCSWSVKINPAVLKKLIPDLNIGQFSKSK